MIVEDEPIAARTLRGLIDAAGWIECVAHASDGWSAIRMADQHQPDLLFLDVEIPELSGLQVLKRIAAAPLVVFTTAYDQYAVAAFEIGALDYLVKPFGPRRFGETLQRIRTRIGSGSEQPTACERARDALEELPLRRLFVRSNGSLVPIRVESIERLEACNDCVAIHSQKQVHVAAISLADLDARLDRERFLRVHRSHVVNLDYVAQIRIYDGRRLLVAMRDGTEIITSRSGCERLRQRAI